MPHDRVCSQGPLKIFAKDLVRTRSSIQKFHQMSAQLRAVEIRITVRDVMFGRARISACASRVPPLTVPCPPRVLACRPSPPRRP